MIQNMLIPLKKISTKKIKFCGAISCESLKLYCDYF